MFWKYAANFQGNEHSCRSAISIKLKLTFFENRASARVFSCTFATYFPKHLFLRTPLKGCFWTLLKIPDRARSSHPDVFLGKGVLKICSKFTAEHPWRSAISIKQPPREVPAKRCSENMQQIYNKVAYLIIRLFISRNHTIRSAPTPTKHKQFSDTSDINIAKKAVKSFKFCRIYCKCVMHALRGRLF